MEGQEDAIRFQEFGCMGKESEELIKKFPEEEKFRLADQMIRASRSITANIAEGYGRYHYQDNIRFCRQARGSVYELLDHVAVRSECAYISRMSIWK